MCSDTPAILAGDRTSNWLPHALWLLFDADPEPDRRDRVQSVLAAIHLGTADSSTLLGACRGERLVGAVWGQQLPGNVALLWPPRLLPDEADAVADALLLALHHALLAKGTRLIQTLLPADTADADRLLQHGYSSAAELLYLSCPYDARATSHDPCHFANSHDLTFEPYCIDQRQRLERLVQQTYDQTLDIPALDGTRSIDEVLTGYEQTGEFAAERWFLIRAAGRDVGCLLLTDHPPSGPWELIYMGLIPEARGRGWGAAIARFAVAQARASRRTLVLAVDSQNDPAIAAYADAGFHEWFRRQVFLKSLPPESAS